MGRCNEIFINLGDHFGLCYGLVITYPSCGQQEVGGGVHLARCVRDLPLTQGHAHYSRHVGLWAKHVDRDSQGVSCDQSKHAITVYQSAINKYIWKLRL